MPDCPNCAELARDERIFVPGNWECPKCKFALCRTSINATTGEFGTTSADREDTEPCPNGCGDLVRETWESRSRTLFARLEQDLIPRMRDAADAREKLARAQEIIERVMTEHWDMHACQCGFCVASRALGFRPRDSYPDMPEQSFLGREGRGA